MGTLNTVLEIDAIVPDRSLIRIKSKLHPEGKLYEIRHREELDLEQIRTLEVLGEKCQTMVAQNDIEALDVADAAKLDDWIYQLLALVFYTPLEPEVQEALDYPQKFKIFAAFNAASSTGENEEAETVAPPAMKKPRTTRKSKPTSVSP